MIPRPGERVEVSIDDLSYLGEGVGHLEENFTIFVKEALPGERVVAVVDERRHRYARAHTVDVLAASPDRVSAPCPYFPTCGGCQVQHLAYERQVAWKTDVVRHQLQRIGKLVNPPVRPCEPAAYPWYYRNQARFSLNGQGHLCFTRGHSRHLLPIDACLIMQQPIVDLMPQLQNAAPGAHQIVVRYGARTGDYLIAPRLPSAAPPSGQEAYREILLGQTFRVSAPSFFQVNTRVDERPLPRTIRSAWLRALAAFDTAGDLTTADGDPIIRLSQADLLALYVLDRLELTGDEVVVDAYGGVGTFALLAAPHARQVIGIEEAKSAVLDAEANAAGRPNARFIVGRTEDELSAVEPAPDAIILDPSRVGCAPEVIQALLARPPRRIVYVSCDPATLARDLQLLCAGPFELNEVQPLDMFPQTHHIESVSLLLRRG